MGFLDRLLGREEPQQTTPQYAGQPQGAPQPAYSAPTAGRPGAAQPGAGQPGAAQPGRSEDEIAVERYRYLLRTAPPETIEQVHEEAFTKLTPEQRRILFTQLSENAPAGEQPRGDDPRSLAQAATRSELRQPGTMERSFNGAGRAGGGMGFGGMVASSLLGTVAGYVIGSALVSAFLPDPGMDQAGADGADGGTDASADGGADGSTDGGADASGTDGSTDGGVDASGADSADASGGDWSGGGGDFGGGDFGGGDFGGGDFGGGFDF